MIIKNKHCKHLFSALAIFLVSNLAYGQAKTTIGIGLAINSSQAPVGYGGILEVEAKVSPTFSLVPSIGVEVPYTAYLGLAGRTYISDRINMNLGGFYHLGGDDGVGDSGPGATVGVGLSVLHTKEHFLSVNLHSDILQINNSIRPLAGLRLVYNYSFKKYAESN
jgi:hypothetical protein